MRTGIIFSSDINVVDTCFDSCSELGMALVKQTEVTNFIFELQQDILDLIILVNFAPSKGEARRLVAQGGVTIDGDKITDLQSSVKLKKGTILKVGKRKFKKFV